MLFPHRNDAWVVHIAKNPSFPSKTLQDSAPADVLSLTAPDKGSSGNSIEVRVDCQPPRPNSTFNHTLRFADPYNPANQRNQSSPNLSMTSAACAWNASSRPPMSCSCAWRNHSPWTFTRSRHDYHGWTLFR